MRSGLNCIWSRFFPPTLYFYRFILKCVIVIKQYILIALWLWCAAAFAQKQPLTYFLPDITYDKNIPTPESYFGHQIGEWHLSHDQLLGYMKVLAAASPRAKLIEHGRSYENRPLIHLVITSEKNQKALEDIKSQHVALTNPAKSSSVDINKVPAVLYQGYSIHGNEPSGGNAAPLVAYYLLAGKNRDIDRLLDEVVIIFDPCFNPDGFNRFASWVNTHKNKNLTANPADREYNEPWPRGRSNHYWFDLNRDWLPAQLPESQGRVRIFHEWKPNVLTDHHEMGTNATFFFMPGVPSRVHPLTPKMNQDLTERIGNYHAEALDAIGSLYYSKEGYDDFYYGKGSTYPDANGCIGILFEQGSSRGHVQESENGELTFAFTIRNQVATSLSTHKAVREMKKDLLTFQRDFYTSGLEEARNDNRKAYIFGEPTDRARTAAFVEILQRHQIEVYQLAKSVSAGGHQFAKGEAFVVPLEQAQYRLIHGIFEHRTAFEDSIFYDISGWTYPMAFNLAYAALEKRAFDDDLLGAKLTNTASLTETPTPEFSEYAYLMEWNEYFAPKALNYLLNQGLRLKVASQPFAIDKRSYRPGTVMLPVAGQNKTPEQIHGLVTLASQMAGVRFYDMDTGLTPTGIDLGSGDFRPLKLPEVLLLVGEGVQSTDAGEIWHLLDQRYDMKVAKVETGTANRISLNRYNVIIMPSGNYGALSGDKLKEWVSNGGTLITYQEAVQWARNAGLAFVELRRDKSEDQSTPQARRPYGQLSDDRGALRTSGAVFENLLDISHPLGYGYIRERLPVFRNNNLYFEPARNAYATPLVYTANPLLSGYLNARHNEQIRNSAGAIVSAVGQGRVVSFADNTNLRAFWYGTNKLLANAIFFGHTISGEASERALPKPPATGGREE